jgi:hypothetical protein
MLDEEGRGTGTVIGAAKVWFDDKGQLQVESYTQPPLSITEVRAIR